MISKMFCLLYLLTVSFFDGRTGRIPNCLTCGFLAASVITDIFTIPSEIPKHLLSAIFFFSLFFITAVMTKGIGIGDVKLAASVGYASGFLKTSIMLILACTAGIAAFLILRIRKSQSEKIPFAPLVAAGYVASELVCRKFL